MGKDIRATIISPKTNFGLSIELRNDFRLVTGIVYDKISVINRDTGLSEIEESEQYGSITIQDLLSNIGYIIEKNDLHCDEVKKFMELINFYIKTNKINYNDLKVKIFMS